MGEEDSRLCPECRRPIHGRADKKFCSDACRNAYNNKQNSDSMNYMRKVNNALRKNRRILAEANPDGKRKIQRDKLVRKGFDFEFITNTYTTKAGDVYRFCYEHGYLDIGEGYFLLVERNESGS